MVILFSLLKLPIAFVKAFGNSVPVWHPNIMSLPAYSEKSLFCSGTVFVAGVDIEGIRFREKEIWELGGINKVLIFTGKRDVGMPDPFPALPRLSGRRRSLGLRAQGEWHSTTDRGGCCSFKGTAE
jgi:hypothetical protein